MAEKPKVTRITAKDETPKKAVKPTKAVKAKAVKAKKNDDKNIFAAIGGYFTGAWYELSQVRWPNRKATWSLTLAVILFSGFFVALILLLDMIFKYLFELIIV